MLLEEDLKYIIEKKFNYIVEEDTLGNTYLLIYDYVLPKGYSRATCNLLIIFPIFYPLTKLDCFFVNPSLTFFTNNKVKQPFNSRFTESYLGLDWQVYSRHIPKWRPHHDRLQNFFTIIENCFQEVLTNHEIEGDSSLSDC